MVMQNDTKIPYIDRHILASLSTSIFQITSWWRTGGAEPECRRLVGLPLSPSAFLPKFREHFGQSIALFAIVPVNLRIGVKPLLI
jgi:hypothetical protein